MKRMKWLGICIAVALMAMALLNVAFAADLPRTRVETTWKNNPKIESAGAINVGEYCFVDEDCGGWVGFTAPESGTYSIYFERITGNQYVGMRRN